MVLRSTLYLPVTARERFVCNALRFAALCGRVGAAPAGTATGLAGEAGAVPSARALPPDGTATGPTATPCVPKPKHVLASTYMDIGTRLFRRPERET